MASEIALLKWMHAKADVDLLQSTSARDERCWRENARRNPRMRFLRRTECIDDAVGNHSRQGENGISRFRVVASAVFELWHQPFSSCGISRFRVVASAVFELWHQPFSSCGISRFRVVTSAVFELWHQPFSSCGISPFRVVTSAVFEYPNRD